MFPTDSKVPRFALLGCCLFFLGAGLLFSDQDSGDEFRELAREELDRLKKLSDDREKVRDAVDTGDLFKGVVQPPLIVYSSLTESKEEGEQDDEEEEKEKEETRNWLVEGVEKLSGDRKLTEEEKASLLDPRSGTRLIDRIVAERDARESERKAREKNKADDFSDDLAGVNLTGLISSKGNGHPANREILDPLKALELKYTNSADNGTVQIWEDDSGMEVKEIDKLKDNPFLNALNDGLPEGFGEDLSRSLQIFSTESRERIISKPPKYDQQSIAGLSIPSLHKSAIVTNPFLDVLDNLSLTESPIAGTAANPLPRLYDPVGSSHLRTAPLTPKVAPKTPLTPPRRAFRPTEEEEKKYFPQLNRF